MPNPKIIKGSLIPRSPLRLGIVVSRFNEFLTRALLEGTLDTLERHGVDGSQVTVAWVPGAWEIPLAAKRMLAGGSYDGLIVLGAVIRGQTPHFDFVAGHATSGISQLTDATNTPIGMGLLTTDTIEQATERVGVKVGNKGGEAALAVLEMIDLLRQLDASGSD